MSKSRSLLPFWQSAYIGTSFGGPVFLWLVVITALGTTRALWDLVQEIFWFPQSVALARVEDLVTFFRVSEMLNAGESAVVYTPEAFKFGLSERLQDLIFLNPPHSLPVFYVFSWVDFGALKLVALLLTIATLVFIARTLRLNWPLTALFVLSAGTVQVLLRLNLSVFVIGLIVLALSQAPRRPIVAGLALALATIKPQYGLLIPFFLLGIGAWRCFFTATAATLGLAALALFAFGPQVFVSYWASFAHPLYQGYSLTALDWDFSVRSTLGRLGAGLELRSFGVVLAMIIGAVLAYKLPKNWPYKLRVGFLLLISAAVAPSITYYSWPLYCAGILYMALTIPYWPNWLQFLAGLTWMQPFIYILLNSYLPAATSSHAVLVFCLIAINPAAFFYAFKQSEEPAWLIRDLPRTG